MSKNKWKCCKTNPPELGKKVLCEIEGDIFVAQRYEDYYIPIPFADHPFAKQLCHPNYWCEIDFPKQLHGYTKVAPSSDGNESPAEIYNRSITMDEYKRVAPEDYQKLADALISSIGSCLNYPENRVPINLETN